MKRHFWLLGLIMLLGLTACSPKPSAHKQLTVVASVNFYGEVAQAVAGDYGHVTAIINNPAVDPHDYEPTTEAAKTVADANVVVVNGAGYDSWMSRLTAADDDPVKTVSAAKVVGVKAGENEHIWYKPKMMVKMANALAQTYGEVDPAHKVAYRKNAQRYIKSLQPMFALEAQLKASAKNQTVAVSEPVFDNTLTALGYRIMNGHFARAIEDSSDPSPQDVRQLERALEAKQVAFFVQNTQVDSKIVTNMVAKAKAAGVPIVKVTETMPKGQTYSSWMMAQYKQIQKIQAR
ncbi:metal ABC transporter solute-binding protein, Zn/Mn family [Lacticaseibacillus suibinensis]|uniref:metal ABC transporter solute-binding protein, Zn/Mn family n=1 Tax=Lacticaseibacillus suibinensis TaxID=2486011 RepID=UPI000F77D8E6|nr:zinc ABC transporter substrate-binding protein [Lacticaseibacillus suibinensis]